MVVAGAAFPQVNIAATCWFVEIRTASIKDGILHLEAEVPCENQLSTSGSLPDREIVPIFDSRFRTDRELAAAGKIIQRLSIGLAISKVLCKQGPNNLQKYDFNLAEDLNVAADAFNGTKPGNLSYSGYALMMANSGRAFCDKAPRTQQAGRKKAKVR
jgi:hypothetical protein